MKRKRLPSKDRPEATCAWGPVPLELVRTPGFASLTALPLRILLVLVAHCSFEGSCFISLRSICSLVLPTYDEDREAPPVRISRAIKHLVDQGWVEIVEKGRARGHATRYRIPAMVDNSRRLANRRAENLTVRCDRRTSRSKPTCAARSNHRASSSEPSFEKSDPTQFNTREHSTTPHMRDGVVPSEGLGGVDAESLSWVKSSFERFGITRKTQRLLVDPGIDWCTKLIFLLELRENREGAAPVAFARWCAANPGLVDFSELDDEYDPAPKKSRKKRKRKRKLDQSPEDLYWAAVERECARAGL